MGRALGPLLLCTATVAVNKAVINANCAAELASRGLSAPASSMSVASVGMLAESTAISGRRVVSRCFSASLAARGVPGALDIIITVSA